jgi:hypothetical protein
MKEENQEPVVLPAVPFPSESASSSEKATPEFGLSVGQAIQNEWFRKDGSSARFYSQFRDFHRLRLYARGEQPIGKYKDELAIDGDLSFLNLDWTPVPIIPKFVDIVVNGMSERLFQPKAYAQDALSARKRNSYQENLEKQMLSKDLLMNVKDNFGIDMFTVDPDELPSTDEELALHMQLNYKPAIEIAEETAISTLLDKNRYSEIRPRLEYDIVTLGITAAKHEFLPGDGVRISYVDPANLVYSYTEDPNFRDCFYWGEVKTVPLTELYKIDPNIDKDTVKKVQSSSQSWYDYQNLASVYGDQLFDKNTCTLLYFNYKTTKEVVYKKKIDESGAVKVIEKGDDFNPPDEMLAEGRFERVSKTIDVWYDGVMVMGTNILLKWELAENMVRPKSASQYAIPNYVACAPRMYKGNIESLLRRMIPFADLIQLTHLKLQQVIARMVPDGIFIDADGISEVDLGSGAAYNPEDALRLYFQTGSVVGRSYTTEGEFNNARVPITPLSSPGIGGKVQTLIASYNHYMDMLRSVTGLNEARDGTTPDPRALVGVQKLAALNSNTATRHILDGTLFITKALAEACSMRIADILQYADFKEEFANQIGQYNVDLLAEIKEMYLYDFGIFIEVAPDEEERQSLEANIQVALTAKDIYLEDAIDIREIKNIKTANQLLKVKRRRKAEKDEQQQMRQQQAAVQGNIQQQQVAAEVSAQKLQLEAQLNERKMQAEAAYGISKLEREAGLKAMLMEREFQYQMRTHRMNLESINSREAEKERGKSKRISQQNTEQSKLIEQRKNNLPPMNFESNEDSLDGFGLEEFSPR